MKTNQDGGAVLAKDPKAAGKQLESNQKSEGAGTAAAAIPAAGAAKYGHKGAADYDTTGEKGSHDHPHGAAKMGYNQSFGAARKGGYAKGAAKVANIMSFGAAKYGHKGAADGGHDGAEGHEHSLFDTGRIKRGISTAANTAVKVGRTALRTAGDIGIQALDFVHPDQTSGTNSNGFNLGGTRAAARDAANMKHSENRHYNVTRDMIDRGQIYDTGTADAFDDDGGMSAGNLEGYGGLTDSGERNPNYIEGRNQQSISELNRDGKEGRDGIKRGGGNSWSLFTPAGR